MWPKPGGGGQADSVVVVTKPTEKSKTCFTCCLVFDQLVLFARFDHPETQIHRRQTKCPVSVNDWFHEAERTHVAVEQQKMIYLQSS